MDDNNYILELLKEWDMMSYDLKNTIREENNEFYNLMEDLMYLYK